MEGMCYISNEEFVVSPLSKRFTQLKIMKTVEDVSTLLEIFECAMIDISIGQIKDVLVDEDGNYLFLTDGYRNKFDLYGFINSTYRGETKVNCINAKMLFPRGKSRGMFTYSDEYVTGDTEEETPTGFLGDDDIEMLESTFKHFIRCKKTNDSIEITESGVVFGRSSAKSDYVISGNGNISREHCRVYRSGNELYVTDINSANGTIVNGQKLPKGGTTVVDQGDTISIAGEELEVD